ncbi:MAG: cation transporter, partial [Planctomycetota bacterium]
AVALMAVGASPGAALAFLIAGPATNAATIAVVGGALGKRTTTAYVAAVLVTAIASGYAFNAIAGSIDLRLPANAGEIHEHGRTWLDQAWAAALLGLMIVGLGARRGWWANGPRDGSTASGAQTEDVKLDELELPVEGMNCSHCVGSVEDALKAVPGVAAVRVDLPGKRATVRGRSLDRDALAAAVGDAGFRVRS